VPANAYAVRESPAAAERQDEDALWRALERLEPAPVEESEAGRRAYEALSWTYPRAAATRLAAKTSVTAMKRMRDEAAEADRLAAAEADAEMAEAEEARAQPDEPDGGAAPEGSFRLRRPRFLSARRLTPAERGDRLPPRHATLALAGNGSGGRRGAPDPAPGGRPHAER